MLNSFRNIYISVNLHKFNIIVFNGVITLFKPINFFFCFLWFVCLCSISCCTEAQRAEANYLSLPVNAISQACSHVQGLFILIGIPIPLTPLSIHSFCQGILESLLKRNSKRKGSLVGKFALESLFHKPHAAPKGQSIKGIRFSWYHIIYSL